MSQASYTYQGNAPAVAGESRYTTDLLGMDGQYRTASPAAKKAEIEFLGRVAEITARVAQEQVEEREAQFVAYRDRLDWSREYTKQQEKEREGLFQRERAAERERREADREADSGEVRLRCYIELGPVWTRRWLKEELSAVVPDIVHAELNSELTCMALRRGVEVLQERRRQGRSVPDAAALVVDVASRWQRSRPTHRVLLHEALLRPDLIAPSR